MPLQIDNKLLARHYGARLLYMADFSQLISLKSQLREREELWAFPLAGDILMFRPHTEEELQILRNRCRANNTTFVVAAFSMIGSDGNVSAFAEGIRGAIRGSEWQWKFRYWWYKIVDTVDPTFQTTLHDKLPLRLHFNFEVYWQRQFVVFQRDYSNNSSGIPNVSKHCSALSTA